MKDSAVVVRPYMENDREGVRALLRATFGDSLGFDRFENGNPLGPAIRAVAAEGSRVVGFNQWQPWLIPGAEGISTFQSGASAVDESFRGHRLFSRLLAEGESQARDRSVGFFIGFPNPASLGAFIRAGWQAVQELDLCVKLVPGLKVGRVSQAQRGMSLPAFYGWRYQAAEVEAVAVGEDRIALIRRIRGRIPAIKLLDVLDGDGNRPVDLLRGISSALPLGRVVTMRCSAVPGGGATVRIPRSWKTPFIVRRIAGSETEELTLRKCNLLYGDIDAA